MALVNLNYYSMALKTPVDVNVLLPEIKKADEGVGLPPVEEYKTVWLFHGMSGDQNSWIRRTDVDLYCTRHGVAFVMPGIGDHWYTNTPSGMRYFDFVAEELPDVCRRYFRGMSAKREMNFVAGCSMGGYGALRCALTHPESYAGCGVFSGALDICRKGRSVNMDLWRNLFDYNMVSADELEGTEHDLFHLAKKRTEEGVDLPALYFRCGTEDGLIHVNRLYHDHLNSLGIDHQYEEAPGAHQWAFFGPSLEKALLYFQSL